MAASLATVILVGLGAGALGALVLLRGLAFAGEALAHTVLLGAVAAAAAGVPLVAGAGLGAAATGALAQGALRDPRIRPDTAIGVLLPAFFGAAVLLGAVTGTDPERLEEILFGGDAAAGLGDALAAAAALAVVVAAFAFAGKELALATLDREVARAAGLPVARLDALVLGLLALVAVVGFRGVGSLLLVAVLLGPPLIARPHVRSFAGLVVAAGVAGGLCALAGSALARAAGLPAGPAVALTILAVFALSLLAARLRAR